ncbi:MAG TPA: DUF11 domain-containing protein, partial [bacterium]|nr:DUF11 domain-containing protein [bacterium]
MAIHIIHESFLIFQHYDLGTEKTCSSDTIFVANELQYFLTVNNFGPKPASNFTVVDSLPPEIIAHSFSITPDSSHENILYWNVDSLEVGEKWAVEFSVDVVPEGTNSPLELTNAALVIAALDTNTANNYATVKTYIREQKPESRNYDLSILKTSSQDTIKQNDHFFYTLTIENFGPATAENITIVDTLPPVVNALEISPAPDSTADRMLFWLADSLPVGDKFIISVICEMAQSYPDTIFQFTNRTSVSAANDTNFANNNDHALTTYHSPEIPLEINFDLAVIKAASVDTIAAGESFSYRLAIYNFGPHSSGKFLLSDALPEIVDVVSYSHNPDSSIQKNLFWFFDTLAAGDSLVVSLEVVTSAQLPQKTFSFLNSAMIIAPDDSNQSNNKSSVVVTAIEPPDVPTELNFDLELDKSADKDTVIAGERLRYYLTLMNAGPGTAKEITISDTLPEIVTALGFSETPELFADRIIFWQLDSLAAGEQLVLSINTLVNPDIADSQTKLVNSAFTYANRDTNLSNNYARLETPITRPIDDDRQNYQLEITKTASADSIKLDQQFQYEIRVKNLGPDIARDITLVDSMPEAVLILDFSPPPDSASPPLYFWDFDSIAVNEEKLILITVKLNPETVDASEPVINVASTFSRADSNYTGSPARVRIIYVESSDDNTRNFKLKFSKTTDVDTVSISKKFSYQIIVENLGPDAAYNLTIVDSLPQSLTILAFEPQPDSISANVAFWYFDSLAAGDKIIINYSAVFLQELPTAGELSIVNVAWVSADGDTNIIGERAQSRIIIIDENSRQRTSYNLNLKKLVDRDSVKVGDPFMYQLTVTNYGPGTAYNITLTDTLPDLIVTSNFNPEPDSISQNVLFWFIDVLLTGEHFTVTFWATIGSVSPRTFSPIKN